MTKIPWPYFTDILFEPDEHKQEQILAWLNENSSKITWDMSPEMDFLIFESAEDAMVFRLKFGL